MPLAAKRRLKGLERLQRGAVGSGGGDLVGLDVVDLVESEHLGRSLRGCDELELVLLEAQVGAKPGSEVCG